LKYVKTSCEKKKFRKLKLKIYQRALFVYIVSVFNNLFYSVGLRQSRNLLKFSRRSKWL